MTTRASDHMIHWTANTLTHRVCGQLTCGDCPWAIELTSDTIDEVRHFLIARLAAHVVNVHDANSPT